MNIMYRAFIRAYFKLVKVDRYYLDRQIAEKKQTEFLATIGWKVYTSVKIFLF